MTAIELFNNLKDSFSSGTLHPDDEVKIYNSITGDIIDVVNSEPDIQTSDYHIVI